ncbi:MAG: acetate uptake transporter [Propionibacteriaceae bacterium]|jgi:succinate-acetate transporter protein|nr:acetate uptake transporter [Propionibacteriaceae bacterium]
MTSTTAPTPVFRPIADPGPLGLAAFALTTFVLSVFNAGLVDASAEPVVFGIALFYGGAVQVVAGVIEFFKNNLFGGVAFCSYGAFWMAFWYLATHTSIPTEHKGTGVGIFLLAWTIFTAYMLIAVSKVNWGLTITFAVLFIAFVGLTVGDLCELEIATRLGGWFGLAAAFSAWYCSFAGVINFTAGKTVLSVGPKGVSSH